MSKNINTAKFVSVWMKAKSLKEVADHFGITPTQASAKAAGIRRTPKGKMLKTFSRDGAGKVNLKQLISELSAEHQPSAAKVSLPSVTDENASNNKKNDQKINDVVTVQLLKTSSKADLNSELLLNIKRTMGRCLRNATSEQAVNMLVMFQREGWID